MIILKSLFFLLFIVAASIGWGRIIFNIPKLRSFQKGLAPVIYPAIGLGVLSYLTLFVGLVGLFNLITIFYIYLIGFLGFILQTSSYDRKERPKRASSSKSFLTVFSLTLLIIALLAIFIKTLAPPADINDALGYHLYCPKVFLDHQKIFKIPYNIDCGMPFFMEMLFAFGIALKEPVYSQLVSYLMGVLLAFAVADFLKSYISKNHAYLASVVLILTSVIYVHMSYAYVEIGLAFYIFMAFYMLFRWLNENKVLYLALSGIFTGFSLSIKVTAGFFFAAVVLYIILRGVREKFGLTDVLRSLFIYGSFSALFSFIWYLRSYLMFGNPIFPFFNGFFNGKPLPELSDFAHHGLGRGRDLISFLRLPWNITFYPGLFGNDRLSPIYLGLLPLTLLVIKRKDARMILFLMLVFSVFWFVSCPRTRFLIPILPLCSIISCMILAEASMRIGRIAKTALFCFVFFFLCLETAAVIYNTRDRVSVALGIEKKEDYLMRKERTYPVATYINEHLPKNAKVLAFEARLFYFDRDMIRDDTFSLFTGYDKKSLSKKNLATFLKEKGITHILFYAASPSEKAPSQIAFEPGEKSIYAENGYYLYKI